jgi:hypothetical protein
VPRFAKRLLEPALDDHTVNAIRARSVARSTGPAAAAENDPRAIAKALGRS